MLNIDIGDDTSSPSNPVSILEFVRDNVGHANLIQLALVEDRLYNRLRILREREQSCDLIREALVLCADRRREITVSGGAACPTHSDITTKQVSK